MADNSKDTLVKAAALKPGECFIGSGSLYMVIRLETQSARMESGNDNIFVVNLDSHYVTEYSRDAMVKPTNIHIEKD